jgi:hypothetical protein
MAEIVEFEPHPVLGVLLEGDAPDGDRHRSPPPADKDGASRDNAGRDSIR